MRVTDLAAACCTVLLLSPPRMASHGLIKYIAVQMAKTQKNKATSGHLGLLKVRQHRSMWTGFK